MLKSTQIFVTAIEPLNSLAVAQFEGIEWDSS